MAGGIASGEKDWPIFGLRIDVEGLSLRHVRESDLPVLAAIQPDDYEHDPGPERLARASLAEHRRRLVYQGYWRSVGTWTPRAWCLDFLVQREGRPLGVQSLEAEWFTTLGTVDSGSWLVDDARGQGVGRAMRRAVLGLAFDHLGARAAVSSARHDNRASLTISRQLGYRDNGVSLTDSGSGPIELQHLRLIRAEWVDSGLGHGVEVTGLEACRPWFGLGT